MSNAESSGNPARSSSTWFVLAGALLVIGGFSSPLFVALALCFAAAGFAVRRNRQDILPGALLLGIVVLGFGYGLGKDLAQRDNARSASYSADGG